MAFQVCTIMAGLVVGWIRKGSLWSITNIRLKGLWLLPIAYILQHFSISSLTGTTYQIALVVSYLSIIWFCLMNLQVPGVLWTMGGTIANFAVMAVNGLRMPAYIPAVRHIAPNLIPLLQKGEYGKSVAMTTSTHLNFLGDIFSFQIKPVSLISIGDILFAIGLAILIQHAMRSQRGETHLVSQTQAN